MAFEINELRKPADGGQWISDARICLTEDGALVDCEDPAARTLLVAAGGSLPAHVAESYGLVGAGGEAPKAQATPANKARKGTRNKSGGGAAPPQEG